MKLYERIENNNFDEIDKNRAIELIEGGNGHLVYNENYFKLQKENEELKFEERRRIIGKYGDSEIRDVINRTLSNDYMKNEYVKLYQDLLLKENVIPVQKVKDKIEHYQKLQDNYIEKYDEINEGLQAMINALQELLEGRK